jgi:hypothetical protein
VIEFMAVDPGGATGVALGHYDDKTPITFTETFTIPNGAAGFGDWWHNSEAEYREKLIVETFVPRANEFLASVAGVEVIGFIKGTTWRDPIWQSRSDKALLTGNKPGVDSEAKNNAFLKEHGLWLTGKQVGWKDGRDAMDAEIHALVYAKKIRHIPTLRQYWS